MRRVFVIANNALCKTNSNGFTLINQLRELKLEEIITFSIDSPLPDKDTALAHFKLTDKEKLKYFFKKKKLGHVILNDELVDKDSIPNNVAKHKGLKESAFGLAIREIVWKFGRWDKSNLFNYIDEYKPTSILFMCGRSIFMNNLTTDLHGKYNIPIYVYTSEDEYFHKYPFYKIIKNILQIKLKKSYRRLICNTDTVICQHDKLNDLFKNEFNCKTVTIYPRPTIPYIYDPKVNDNGPIVYIGNSQPNRLSSLIDFAETLYKVAPKEECHLYCGDLTNKNKKKLEKLPNVVIKTPVSRNQVVDVMRHAKLLVHVESFRKKDKVLIENAFSTKTIDTISSGVPFMVYAPPYIGSYSYLKDKKTPFAVNKDELENCLNSFIVKRNYNNIQNKESINDNKETISNLIVC